MVLAGGQGTRLKELTKFNAKPAVPFGGKYRIIDFTLSNCTHSGIDTVGILTQYQPLTLNNHIGIGSSWDLDKMNGGITILPPHVSETGMNWYSGTADAIYQNINFVDYYEPDYIIVLSGDHIYKMNYSSMLKYHKEKNADATIAVIEIPLKEAYRFGIMNTDKNGRITQFEEKPHNPKSNMASMGIYIFNWKIIKEFLKHDESNPYSGNDFGKDIIPSLIRNGKKLFAYPFKGYWKDVGTIQSYWEANMDLLRQDNKLNLYEDDWKIYSNTPTLPPQYIGNGVKLENSMISDGCVILGDVINSILFPRVHVDKNSRVTNSVILPNVTIENDVIIDKAIIGNNCVIKHNNIISNSDQIVLIGEDREIGLNSIAI